MHKDVYYILFTSYLHLTKKETTQNDHLFDFKTQNLKNSQNTKIKKKNHKRNQDFFTNDETGLKDDCFLFEKKKINNKREM